MNFRYILSVVSLFTNEDINSHDPRLYVLFCLFVLIVKPQTAEIIYLTLLLITVWHTNCINITDYTLPK